MDEPLSLLLVLVLSLVGFGYILTGLNGKPDPFLLLRPLGRYSASLPGRSCRLLSKSFYRARREIWQGMRRQPWFLKIALATIAIGLGFLGVCSAILADIFGTKR